MKMNLNDGDAYIEGRSPAKAQELLEKAAELGLEGRIRTTSYGYIVPAELAEPAGEQTEEEIQEQDEREQDETQETPEDQSTGDDGDTDLYDPSEATVEEVIAYLDNADEAEVARVLEAEKASDKPRKGILSYEAEGAK